MTATEACAARQSDALAAQRSAAPALILAALCLAAFVGLTVALLNRVVFPLGGGGGSSTSAPSLVIKSLRTSLGTVLVGSDGLTLYIHAGDGTNHSTCTGDCAAAWPPVLVKAGSKVGAGAGVRGKLATFKRADGTLQVSYNGRPLYGWTGDGAPGDTTGEGIGGFTAAKA